MDQKQDNGLHLLIADDHQLVRQGLCALIVQASLGYTITDVANGEQAFHIIKSRTPDVAILDITMGKLSGLEVCELVKQHQLKTRIIFLSMHDNIKIVDRALNLGAYGYIPKSEAFGTLIKAIQNVSTGEYFISPSLQQQLHDFRKSKRDFMLTTREQENKRTRDSDLYFNGTY
ncbi:response regulator transcription factor [Pseudoalteromonas luteoviolacea]|uniref:response regulator n=1 Tax=Pseudoalteromonas luteoviolacea TaxID=43657 RepID=UPI001B36E987|nr:response regulator transcription factor [Pseudoalteromonas luteoviolacea]MBQ4811655.1 response regulator transcription factor [Pseudoalteromonas luteoviolacea]